ncbi:MAG TPA: 4a-hydroxytetrahydrobiopterin dehydratase [Gammaproteobacteria bacterium]
MTKLALRRCTPVKKGSKPISAGIARSLLNQVNNKWRLDPQAKFIEREFDFTDFRRTIEFVNAVAWVANGQDHHPDLEVNYGCCRVRYSTHAAGGLTVNDFICAAKIDALFSDEKLKISPSSPKRQHPASPAAVDESPSIVNRETLSE